MSKYNEDLDYLIQNEDITEKELNEIIVEADKIISDTNSEKDKLIEAYLKKVQCLQKLDRSTESKEFIDKLLDLNPNMPEALVRLGNFYDENNDYDSAIDYVTKAIDLKKEYAYAYSRRASFYDNKGNYDKALQDYSNAIHYKSEYAIAYFNRSISKFKKDDYYGAIEDCSKAIEFKPNDALAYYNRGVVKGNLPEPDYDGAIKDYSKAIEINPKYAPAYNNRGVAKENLPEPDYDGAIEDYTKAIEINPNDASAYNNRGYTYVKMKNYKNATKDFRIAGTNILNVLDDPNGEEVAKLMIDDDVFFKEVTKECKKKEIEDYKDIYIKSLSIISKLQIKDKLEMPVSHYTKKDISEKLLFDDYSKDKNGKYEHRSIFRLNSVNTSNDPEEGKTLFHYLFPEKNISLQVEEFGAFAGCFIMNNDSLNQFRLYGKTEDKEEGTGVCITLNNRFFNNEIIMPLEATESKDKKKGNLPSYSPLFRCIYIDPETAKIVSLGQKEKYIFYRENKGIKDDDEVKKIYQEYKNIIDDILKDIKNELSNLKKQIEDKKLDSDIVHKLLLNLSYLVKHVAFKEEQECRIIQIRKLSYKEKVQADDNNRLFVEYLELSHENVSEICFAPKTKDIDKFKQHLARNGYNVKCYKSKAPLA
ncbi:MAG: tetratricopeptide repeat protein [Fibromonadaceae bacterium]|jgi:tetratricopeptide (TPR) repeat protein|nr:tetratricopeptide repeat protein [Fibromonadaceae bacterium]